MSADQGRRLSVWYISKYLAPPGESTVGNRGYHIMRELAARGNDVSIITSTSNHLAVTPDPSTPH
ncbi:hypothetical protein J7E68_11430, partial [Microbacterium sp. ISL-103]|uniref:hypothetical protein n=1 Tax=Microbacterium sp. ISL-103 TaxID=2819156 RepID=UPI001BE4E1B0